jgi:hypothetical protein
MGLGLAARSLSLRSAGGEFAQQTRMFMRATANADGRVTNRSISTGILGCLRHDPP